MAVNVDDWVALHVAVERAAAGLAVDGDRLPPRVGRALRLAAQLGAPRAPTMAAALTSLRQQDELERAVAVATAEGRGVARALVMAPPVLGPLLALLVTDDPWAVWSTGAGHAVLGVAVVLWACGAAAVRHLVRRAGRPPAADDDLPGEEFLEALAVAIDAGLGLAAGLRWAAAEVPCTGARATAVWIETGAVGDPPPGWASFAHVVVGARDDGLPLARVVRAAAAARRVVTQQVALERAARLGPRLTVPTTLLLLPAAMLVAVAPLLHGALDLVA